MTAFNHVVSPVWYAVLKFLHNWDVILRQHSPHIHFSQHEDAGSRMQLVCHTLTRQMRTMTVTVSLFFWCSHVFLNVTNLSKVHRGLLKANQLYFLPFFSYLLSLSRHGFKLSSSASVYASSSLRHPVVGDFLLAPPHIHSTWNFPCYSGLSQPFRFFFHLCCYAGDTFNSACPYLPKK